MAVCYYKWYGNEYLAKISTCIYKHLAYIVMLFIVTIMNVYLSLEYSA